MGGHGDIPARGREAQRGTKWFGAASMMKSSWSESAYDEGTSLSVAYGARTHRASPRPTSDRASSIDRPSSSWLTTANAIFVGSIMARPRPLVDAHRHFLGPGVEPGQGVTATDGRT